MSNKNEVFEYLVDQLRQQVNINQCEDLVHEVQSLKSELARYKKPYIAYVKKTDWVQGDSRFLDKWGKHRADILRECIQEQDAEIQSLKNQLRDMSEVVDGLKGTITLMNGDVEAYKVLRKGAQSGCRKEDTQECEHSWIIMPGLFLSEGNPDNIPGSELCSKCGKREWDDVEYKPKNDTQECEHDWVLDEKGDYFVCAKCGKQEAELIDCQHTNTVGLRKGFAPGFTKKCLDCGAKLK